ncbi:MAG: YbaB/EbfC family nucleoid-associated protein [Bacilli bacterium]
MNMQAMLKQAQQLQKNMLAEKEKLDNEIFEEKTSFVSVKITGSKLIKEIKLDTKNIEEDEIEMLEDMIMITINNALSKIEKETEHRMGKYTQGMPGLF